MKKYNKGVTIVEIIISIVIISIVLSLLFSLLVQVRNEDAANESVSSFAINKATIIKEVEDDIMSLGVENISKCNINEFVRNPSVVMVNPNDYICLRIQYADRSIRDNVGALLLYKYKTNPSDSNSEQKWLIRYLRGYYQNCSNQSIDYNSMKFRQSFTVSKDYPSDTFTNISNILKIRLSSLPNDASLNYFNVGDIIIEVKSPTNGNRYDISIPFTFEDTSYFRINPNDFTVECVNGVRCNNANGVVQTSFVYRCPNIG